MLLVVPEVPNQASGKPLLQGYGCRLRGGTLSCEVLFVGADIPAQTLPADLYERGRVPQRVALEWTPLEPRLWKQATITISEEET